MIYKQWFNDIYEQMVPDISILINNNNKFILKWCIKIKFEI